MLQKIILWVLIALFIVVDMFVSAQTQNTVGLATPQKTVTPQETVVPEKTAAPQEVAINDKEIEKQDSSKTVRGALAPAAVVLPQLEVEAVVKEVVIPPTTRELFAKYFPKEDYDDTVAVLSKVLRREAGCVMKKSQTNCAAVIWCILNRVDTHHRGDTPIECATADHQFAWVKHTSYSEDFSNLVEDVLGRWLREKEGETDVGRVLPADYVYFIGKHGYNNFTTTWHKGERKFTPKHSDVYGD